ncbi:ABC transporter ATP-binding protein [Paenibacillus sp. GCM10027627]|uniref:ABC transporter ATP-binding protein n=1 Tax=unclassified Paenibacillus TaxID=185978 RepID=UPI0036441DC0
MKKEFHISAVPRVRELVPMMWNRLGGSKFIFVLAVLFCLSDMVISMLIPYTMELYFNALESGDLQKVQFLLIAFNIGLLLLSGLGLLGHYLKQSTMSTLHRKVQLDLADQAQRMPLEKVQATPSADLSHRIIWDTNQVTLLLTKIFNTMAGQVFMLILAVLYMFTLQWQVALGVMLLMPLCLIGSHLMRYRLQKIAKEVSDQESIMKQCQQDALQNMDMLRAFDAGDWMVERFTVERDKLNALYLRKIWWDQLVHNVSVTAALLISWGSILVTAWLAVQGKIQLGALMAFFILIWRVYDPLLKLGQHWGEVQQAKGAASRIAKIWNAKRESAAAVDTEPPSATPVEHSEEVLVWNDIRFHYEENAGIHEEKAEASKLHAVPEPLLNDFHLSLGRSAFTAIVGASGSGKSTVAKLGASLLFPIHGTVSICGAASTDSADKARTFVSYVPQNPYLFSGTIKDNLLMAKPGATDQEIRQAAEIAEVHAFIESLPNGYDTPMSEHGSSLSGGQKQRMAIARAVLADRPVWILDEATSALDMETERRVMDAVLKRAKERGSSVLVIAHRLTTIQDADRIIAMENGIIAEEGTHRELLGKPNGLYRKLWSQMEGSEFAAVHSA